MNQVGNLVTRGTLCTTFILTFFLTKEVIGDSQCIRECYSSFRRSIKMSVRSDLLLQHLNDAGFSKRFSSNLFKKHDKKWLLLYFLILFIVL